jgi:hypothetical protein
MISFSAVNAVKSQHAPEILLLKFECLFNGKPVQERDSFANGSVKNAYNFTKIRQYISGIRLLKTGNEVWVDSGGYYLIDLLNPEKSIVFLKTNGKDFDEIQFIAGIDSVIQEEGVKGGALDPINGMYWTWQSGYIHTKIEGFCRENELKSPYELHLGGYTYPNSTVISVAFKNIVPKAEYRIQFNLEPLLETMHQIKVKKVMSPGSIAVKLTQSWTQSVKLLP